MSSSNRSCTRIPIRFILSAYVGPIPRPVVPILRLPANRSVTLSRVVLYGGITPGKGSPVDLLVVSVGTIGRFDAPDELQRSAANTVELATVRPDSALVDGVLDRRDGRRLVIDAGLAGLNLVLSRLMRRGE